MTLGFSTHINGMPTNFVAKIWAGFKEYASLGSFAEQAYEYGADIYHYQDYRPKLHSIRTDEKNRWKVGMKIHMVTGNRTPNRFQFAPVLSVQAIQKIMIIWSLYDQDQLNGVVGVYIDEEEIGECEYRNDILVASKNFNAIKKLAINDGFDTLKEFFQYFNGDFVGKIIHWTDLKYYPILK